MTQPIGFALNHWQAPAFPTHASLQGHFCTLEPLSAEQHGEALFHAKTQTNDDSLWTYLAVGPFAHFNDYRVWLNHAEQSRDPQFYAIVDAKTQQALGVISYMRIEPAAGCIEIGHLCFSPSLQKTPAATEAVYLLIKHAFALGYRRVEWKCDDLNAPSKRAALRFGFTYEGLFRQATVVKNRNRDTAWFSIIDPEWPRLEQGFKAWLKPENFDAQGLQLQGLQDCLAQAKTRA